MKNTDLDHSPDVQVIESGRISWAEYMGGKRNAYTILIVKPGQKNFV
jgi:hypothetical protein